MLPSKVAIPDYVWDHVLRCTYLLHSVFYYVLLHVCYLLLVYAGVLDYYLDNYSLEPVGNSLYVYC